MISYILGWKAAEFHNEIAKNAQWWLGFAVGEMAQVSF
jgi:hypothetical protein